MAEKISIYEGNSAIIGFEVLNPDGTDAVLSGFTATLNIKEKKTDITALISKTGTISGNEVTFAITDTDNELTYGTYYYEVVLTSTTQKLTVAQERFHIKQSIIYIT